MRNPVIEEDLKFIAGADLPWKQLEGKTILIAGANGFLPAYMIESILYLNEKIFKNKARVIALARNQQKAENRFAHYQGRPDLEFVIQDVCQPIKIKEKVDFIIHGASQASPKYFGKDPVGTLLPNVMGTMNLLELAREKKAEGFLFFSSGEVYGDVAEKDIPIKEENYGYIDPTAVRSCYAEGKRMGETLCVSYFHQYGVPAKIIRIFHTFGPGMQLDDGRVFADFVSNIVKGQNIILKSDGSAVRSFCYLADATAAFFTVLLKGKAGEAYNIGNEKGEMSILNLANMLVEAFPEKKLKVEKTVQKEVEGYLKSKLQRHHPDISKIQKLGWQPHFSVRDGFIRTVKSYLKNI